MKLFIADSGIADVGDFAVPVAYDGNRFRFMDYADVLTHPLDFELIPKEKDGWSTVPFGTTEEGGYAFNFMSGTDGNNSAAMFFLQGNMGLVFRSSDGGLLRPLPPFREISALDFVEKVEKEYGENLGC